jgi:hypothetical protein
MYYYFILPGSKVTLVFQPVSRTNKVSAQRILFGSFRISNEGNIKLLIIGKYLISGNQITVSKKFQCTEFSLKPIALGQSTSTQLHESKMEKRL